MCVCVGGGGGGDDYYRELVEYIIMSTYQFLRDLVSTSLFRGQVSFLVSTIRL